MFFLIFNISRVVFWSAVIWLAVFGMTGNVRAGMPAEVVLATLQGNAKLKNAEEVLADFYAGEAETGVIVYLKSSVAATALASEAKQSSQVPEEFNKPGAPPYYNLKDESVKKALSTTVRETVDRTINSLDSVGLTVKQKFTYQFGFAARVTPAALDAIVNNPDVIEVAKDHILHAHLAQGIPLMNATSSRASYSGSGVSIAICDTGIDTSHPRLGGGGFPNAKVIGGYDTGDNDADPRPNSLYGDPHGTACAGIAAGNTGTVGDYIGGVAPGAKLYAIKISTGNTGDAYLSAMVAGWEWAITHQNDDPANPIMIISTSFGGDALSGRITSECDVLSSSMTTAAANAVAAGITVFASSGNNGYCDAVSWPACISSVNAVGAVYDANIGTYSTCISAQSCAPKTATANCTTGYYASDTTSADMVTSYSNSASFLTLLAPANAAYTTDIAGSGGYAQGDYATSFGGTSAASPYAAGAAAVLQSAAKSVRGGFLTPAQVRRKLVVAGDNVVDGKNGMVKPRINLDRAVAIINNGPTAPLLLLLNGN